MEPYLPKDLIALVYEYLVEFPEELLEQIRWGSMTRYTFHNRLNTLMAYRDDGTNTVLTRNKDRGTFYQMYKIAVY
jgi:hypothetical protein